MEYDWGFAQKIKCSQEEKRHCMELAAGLVSLATKGRRHGLLSLMQDAEESASFLLRKGLHLILDGVKSNIIREILELHIVSGDYRGKQLLERCLILEGVLAIQSGIHTKIVKELLMSFLGEDGQKIFEAEFEQKTDQELKAFLKNIKDTHPPSAPALKLDRALMKMNDREIHRFLKEINTTDLARAVKGMGGKTQLKIFNNLSKKAASMLQEAVEYSDFGDESEMQAVYDKIEAILTDLKAREKNHSSEEPL
jgi:hypothetical protein